MKRGTHILLSPSTATQFKNSLYFLKLDSYFPWGINYMTLNISYKEDRALFLIVYPIWSEQHDFQFLLELTKVLQNGLFIHCDGLVYYVKGRGHWSWRLSQANGIVCMRHFMRDFPREFDQMAVKGSTGISSCNSKALCRLNF